MSFCKVENDKVCQPKRNDNFHNQEDLTRSKCKVPDGLKDILTFICKEVIRAQPKDIPAFIAALLSEEIKKHNIVELNEDNLDAYLERAQLQESANNEKTKRDHYKAAPHDLIRDKRSGVYAMHKMARQLSRHRSTETCEGSNRVVKESRVMSTSSNVSEDLFAYLRDTVTSGTNQSDKKDQLSALTERYLTMEQQYAHARQLQMHQQLQSTVRMDFTEKSRMGSVVLIEDPAAVSEVCNTDLGGSGTLGVTAFDYSSSFIGELDRLQLPSIIQNTQIELEVPTTMEASLSDSDGFPMRSSIKDDAVSVEFADMLKTMDELEIKGKEEGPEININDDIESVDEKRFDEHSEISSEAEDNDES